MRRTQEEEEEGKEEGKEKEKERGRRRRTEKVLYMRGLRRTEEEEDE